MKSSLRIVYSLIVFILGIVLLSALTVLLIYENSQATVYYNQVGETQELRRSLNNFYSTINEAESAQRGFILTRDSSFIDSYHSARNLVEHFYSIDSLSGVDESVKKDIKALKQLSEKRILQLDLGMLKAASSLERSNLTRDSQTMDSLKTLLKTIEHQQFKILRERQSAANRHSALPMVFGIAISLFSIVIFILAFYFINTELKFSNRLNNELESKNLQLEKYTMELSSFTRIMSHDMQEPLRKIELFISLIEDREFKNLSPNTAKYFDKIKDSVARMRRLFLSILNFYLTDQIQHKTERVNLDEVLHDTLGSLKVYIRDTNATIISKPLPDVLGVRPQLVQLFENIIGNSLKFKMEDTIPEIKISCEKCVGHMTGLRELKKDRSYYRIDFRDNGIGFEQKYVEKIFEIFQRLQVSNETYGVGIGLAICKRIAQNHQGTLTAQSALNQGSLFSLYLPVDRQKDDEQFNRAGTS